MPLSPQTSVIITCHNHGHFLVEAIESALGQTVLPHEIVVVDDGSTDNTSGITSSCGQVGYFRIPQSGLPIARNVGLRNTSGAYVIFLDADDRLLPIAVEAGMKCLWDNPDCAFGFGRYRRIARDGSIVAVPPAREAEPPDYRGLLQGNYIAMHGAVIYRRAHLEAVGGFDPTLRACEDYDLYLRLAKRYSISRHGEVVAEYRDHGANMSADCELMLKSSLAVLRSQRQFIAGKRGLLRAYNSGITNWQLTYGVPLARQVFEHVRSRRHLRQGLRKALLLCSYAPRAVRIRGSQMILNLLRRRFHRMCASDLRRLEPLSQDFGFDRGLPIDRFYIEGYLARHATDIRGLVLEVGGSAYTNRFGGRQVLHCDIVDLSCDNPRATIVADLQCAYHIPDYRFDCIVLTQTLQFIYDTRATLQTLHRILKPNGILLASFPGITKIGQDSASSWYWHFTLLGAKRLFSEVFGADAVQAESFGNVLTATAFLYGMASEELTPAELNYHDPQYEVLIAVRAQKAP